MNPEQYSSSMLPFLFVFLFFVSCVTSASRTHENLLRCLYLYVNSPSNISNIVYTPYNSSYHSILQSTIQNQRFNSSGLPKPLLDQNASQLVSISVDHWIKMSLLFNRWQYIANKLPDDIIIVARVTNSGQAGNRTIVAEFLSLFLGGIDRLLPLMEERLPELGLKKEDCSKMSWIESVSYIAQYPSSSPLDILLDRTNMFKSTFKSKSDFVKEAIPGPAFKDLLKWFSGDEAETSVLNLVPYGGKMSEIVEASIPNAHRAGNLYKISYLVNWHEQNVEVARKHMSWIRKVYRNMAPYVSKNPREAYVNYRDLDIGRNNKLSRTSYKQASIWGTKYFKNNFNRLVRVKTAVDPSNFFRK